MVNGENLKYLRTVSDDKYIIAGPSPIIINIK